MTTIEFIPKDFTSLLPRLCAVVGKLIPEKKYDLVIKEHHEKRSLTANAFFWVLCEKLAQANHITKEEVYLNAIRDVGLYRDFHLNRNEVSSFRTAWSMLGTGWPTEEVDYEGGDSVVVRAYYGSSTYSKKRMARLIDSVVQDCEACGIETMPPEKLRSLIEQHEPVTYGGKNDE